MRYKTENSHLYMWRELEGASTQRNLYQLRKQPHIYIMTTPFVTIWYDGACPLCVAEISLIARLDAKKGRLAFIDLTGDGTCPLDRGDMLAKFHAQESGKSIVSGAAAFGAMWRQVTPFQPLGWLTMVPPFLWALNVLYVQFLRIRPRLQKWMVARQRLV